MTYTRATKYSGFSSTERVNTDSTGLVVSRELSTDYGQDGVVDSRQTYNYAYNESRQLVQEDSAFDNNADGVVDYQNTRSLAYDPAGRLASNISNSPDWNGDSLPDYSTVTTHSYTEAGQIASIETKYLFDGVQSQSDYRLETYTWTPDGREDVVLTDDWATLDFVVGKDTDYDSLGRVVAVKQMDPFVYGDEGWHQTDSWTYLDAENKLIYSGDQGHFQTTTTQVSSSHTKELTEHLGDFGEVTQRLLVETWKNAAGQTTDVLVSHDGNLDGKFTPGSQSGYLDSRDRTKMKYLADLDGDGVNDLTSMVVDNGLDKIIDYSETVVFDALVA